MLDVIKCAGILLLYFLLFFLVGSWVRSGIGNWQTGGSAGGRQRTSQRDRGSVIDTILIGFFAYYLLFQIVTIPMMFTLQPLSRLTGIWTGLMIVLILASAVRFGKQRKQRLPDRSRTAAEGVASEKGASEEKIAERGMDRIWRSVSWLMILAQAAVVSVITYSYWDATYYVGTVSFSVYHNAINTYNPLTGRLLDQFDLKHCLATYHMHDAVICQLFDIHPLIETKTIMVIVVALLVGMTYYRIARYLFCRNEFAVAAMMGFCLLLNLCSYSLYTSASFLIFRTYEGKAITGALTVTMLFYLFLKLYGRPEQSEEWRCLFVVSWGAMAISASAMILVPVAIGACACVIGLHERRLRYLWQGLICCLPCLVSLLLYLMYRLGFLTIHVWR